MQAVKALNWRKGPKNHCFDRVLPAAMKWAVAKSTLYSQVGLTLKARAHQLSQRCGTRISVYTLRRIYRVHGIRQQRLALREEL